MEPFDRVLLDENTSLNYIRKSVKTKRIEELDSVFDYTFEGMRDFAFANLKHYDGAMRHAAENIEIVFNKYGNIGKEPYRQELAASYNLLQDLRAYNAEIETINLVPWMAAHEEAANNLAALLNERTDETAQKTHLRIKETRRAVDKVYHQIIDRIDSMINIYGVDYVPGFVNKYNAHAMEYKVKLAQHLGRIQAGKDDEDEEDNDNNTSYNNFEDDMK
jgi:hypothetical protein